jgi:hypothetical protein
VLAGVDERDIIFDGIETDLVVRAEQLVCGISIENAAANCRLVAVERLTGLVDEEVCHPVLCHLEVD